MNSGLNDYESLVNTTGNEYLEQDLAALEVQIIALQVEETRNYKLNGSKQMDNGYTPTNDYDLITLKFFLEHNIITMSFLRTDGGNAMLADITMESLNEIDINGCRAISNQNTESKVNYQTFDYRTILQNGYYTGNTINDWVGNNSIIISHKDGKVTINEATIDFSNNQIVNFSQLNNITAAEVATLAGSDTNTTLQTQINDGMTEIGNLTAEVLNLDNEFKILDSKAIKQGNNSMLTGFGILAQNSINIKSMDVTNLMGHVNLGQHECTNKIDGKTITITSDFGTHLTSYYNETPVTGGPFTVDFTPGISLTSYRAAGQFTNAAGYITGECNDFNKIVHNNELQTITGNKTININGDYKLTSNIYDVKSNSLTLTSNTGPMTFTASDGVIDFTASNGPIDFKSPNGHFHLDAKNVNLTSNDEMEIEAKNVISLKSTDGNVDLSTALGNINLVSNKEIKIESVNKIDINTTAGDTNIGGNNIIVSSNQQTEIKAPFDIKIESKIIDIIGDASLNVKSNGNAIIDGSYVEFKTPNNKLLFLVNNIPRDISKYLSFYHTRSNNSILQPMSNTVLVTNLVLTEFDFYHARNNWGNPWFTHTDQVAGVTYQFGNGPGNSLKGGFYNLPRSKYILKTDMDLKYFANANNGLVVFRWAMYEIKTTGDLFLECSRNFVCGNSDGHDTFGYGSVSSVYVFDSSAINALSSYKVVLEFQGTKSLSGSSFYVLPDMEISLRGVDF